MPKEIPFLNLYWFPLEEDAVACSALIAAVGKLEYLEERFLELRDEDFSRALGRLEYHLENYFTRAHWLRERATLAILVAAGLPLAARNNHNSIDTARDRLRSQRPQAVDLFDHLRRELKIDMKARSTITHEDFFSLMVITGRHGSGDLDGEHLQEGCDAAVGDPELRSILVGLMRDMATEYAQRCRRLVDLGCALQEALLPGAPPGDVQLSR